jgi:hypothetical protein
MILQHALQMQCKCFGRRDCTMTGTPQTFPGTASITEQSVHRSPGSPEV